MPSKCYTLQFYTADQNNEIYPLQLKPRDSKEHKIVHIDNPDHLVYDAAIRRISKILTQHETHPELARIKYSPDAAESNSVEPVCILLVHSTQLCNSRFFFNLSNGPLRETETPPGSPTPSENKSGPKLHPRPVITICPADIFTMYEESPGLDFELEKNIDYWQDIRKQEKILYRADLDHRVKFLDSSIWHRYVCTKGDFDTNFANTLSAIIGYADLHLYDSLAALATLEFHCRMLQNSFIAHYGDRGHHEAVTPFKFHSETVMANKAEKMLREFFYVDRNGRRLADLQWNVMMVDDYSDRRIALQNKSDNNRPTDTSKEERQPTKREIIEAALKGSKSLDDNLQIHINAVTRGETEIISSAIGFLKTPENGKTFDIILLDYLLGKSELNPKLKAYGHEFLLELSTHKERRSFRRGPMGKHWISLISSFPFAFWDKLRQMNLDGSTEQWHIAAGGDPLSTPEQFRLNFFRLLARQIAEFYLHEAALERWIDRFETILKKEEWTLAVRTQMSADKTKAKVLAHDRDKGSAFAESLEGFLTSQKDYNNFWEGLKSWIQMLDNYHPGQPNAELFLQLESLMKGSDDGYLPICKRLEQQLIKILRDAEADLKNLVIQLAKEQDPKLTFIKQSLFSFPQDIPGLHPGTKFVNFSDNELSDFNLLPGQWSNLCELDLSDNKQLAIISAEELLLRPDLRKINLTNTRLAQTAGLINSYSNSIEDTQSLLRVVADYLKTNAPKPKEGKVTDPLVAQLKQEIASDKIESCLTRLLEHFEEQNKNAALNQAILLSAKLNEIKLQVRYDQIAPEIFAREKVRVRGALLALIDEEL